MSLLPRLTTLILILSAVLTGHSTSWAADVHPLSGIPLRSIGPALTSGRVSDFAFYPGHPEIHYVAFASGGIWKTVNYGRSPAMPTTCTAPGVYARAAPAARVPTSTPTVSRNR